MKGKLLTLGPTSPGGPGSPGKPTGPYRVRDKDKTLSTMSTINLKWMRILKKSLRVSVIQGFLWVRRLRVVLVLQLVQMFQVVPPLPSRRALLEDPASDTISSVHVVHHAVEEFIAGSLVTHLLAGLSADSRGSRLTGFSLRRIYEGERLFQSAGSHPDT